LSVAVSVLLLFISYASITTFVPLFADFLKVNSGLFFLVYSATLFLSRPIGGKLSDQYGEMFVVVPALLISILALIVLSVSTGLFGMLVSATLYGIGFGSAQPVLQATILRLVPPDRRGVASASFSTATDLGIGLGSIIFGWVAKYASYQILFTISAVSVIFSLLGFVFFVKHLLKSKGLR
jgi:MFS family permease